MALFIHHRCPKCFEFVTLIQPQYKEGAFKGPAKLKDIKPVKTSPSNLIVT